MYLATAVDLHDHSSTRGVAVARVAATSAITVSHSTTGDSLSVTNTDAGTTGVQITTLHSSASPAPNDIPFRLVVTGKNSAAATVTYGDIDCVILDPVSTSEDSYWEFYSMIAGTASVVSRFYKAGSFLTTSLYSVGVNGATNPGFVVDTTVGSAATGLRVTAAAAAGGVDLSVSSSGTNENMTINAKGSGTITIAGTSTGVVRIDRNLGIGTAPSFNTGGGVHIARGAASTLRLDSTGSGGTAAEIYYNDTNLVFQVLNSARPFKFVTNDVVVDQVLTAAATTATPAGGSTSARLLLGTTAGFGIYYGSGAPTVSAAQGSIYIRSDGSSTSTRLYVNTTGSTTWTNFTSAA